MNGAVQEVTKKSLKIASSKFDESYINGQPQETYTDKAIFYMPALK